MLCFQCEQTASGKGCTIQGVCSKTPQLAGLQDLQVLQNLHLCQLATACGPESPFEGACRAMVIESTFATLTNVNFDDGRFEGYLRQASPLAAEMRSFLAVRDGQAAVPAPPAGLPLELPADAQLLLPMAGPTGLLARSAVVGDEDLFGVLEMAIYGLKGTAAYLYHAEHLRPGGPAEADAERADIYRELFRIGGYLAQACSSPSADPAGDLGRALSECLAVGALNLKVMALLDRAHCEALGTPSPAEVPTTPSADGRPAILVSGHDLGVLLELMRETEGKGVDVYTHGEMLPAHGYPKLRAFEHLKGHFGTHWGNQLHEFRHFPGAILMTSNCLRPPTKRYADRLWTSGPVGFPGLPAIADGDFRPLINKALSLPPFDGGANRSALQGSSQRPTLLTGFGHGAVLGAADKVVEAIKAGQLKHVFVIGGCDGTESARSYFTDLAHATPAESIILTMGCGKFRLNNEDHGTLNGLPRLMDMGQCNDAYGAVVVATKLAEALGCGVQDLPLRFALSWFEQKAVAVLLSLLHLGMKNIRVGPAVPAFLTPSVAEVLAKEFGLQGIDADHEDEDLEKMLQGA